MDTQFFIREAQLDDIGAMAGLLIILFNIEKDFDIDTHKQIEGLTLLINNPNTCKVFVAEWEGKVIGMVTGQALVSTAAGGISVKIEDMVVLQAHRSIGVGAALLKAISDWATEIGAKRLELLTDKTNLDALRFYKKTGWKTTNMISLYKK